MEEIIYQRKNAMGCIWFTFPLENKHSISLFGYRHNEMGASFPFSGDILSFQIDTNKYLKVGLFFITDDKQFIILGFDQLGCLYGKRNENNNYLLINEPPDELMSNRINNLEKKFIQNKLNRLTELYDHVFK